MIFNAYTNDQKREVERALEQGIHAPYVNVMVSTLGGANNASAMINVSLDSRGAWHNGIFHNSRYFMISLSRDGELEQFSKHYVLPKMRKAKVKSLGDALTKINNYIAVASIRPNPLSEVLIGGIVGGVGAGIASKLMDEKKKNPTPKQVTYINPRYALYDVSVREHFGRNLPVRFITYRIAAKSKAVAAKQITNATKMKVVSVIAVKSDPFAVVTGGLATGVGFGLGAKMMEKNPGAAWHSATSEAIFAKTKNLPVRSKEYNRLLGRAWGESENAIISQRMGIPNPSRRHRRKKRGIGLLGIALAGVLGYWLLKKGTG